MLRMSCRDLGSTDCDYVAEGGTAEDVTRGLLAHAERNHPAMFAAMTSEHMEAAGRRMDQYLARPEARVGGGA